jgi:hypothetical protein
VDTEIWTRSLCISFTLYYQLVQMDLESWPEIPRDEQDDLGILLRALSIYDPVDILASCGALSLMPQNASRLLRIQALAHVACCMATQSGRPISRNRLGALFRQRPLNGATQKVEDPFPNLFVEEIALPGDVYRVFPGITYGSTFVFRRLIEAVFGELSQWPSSLIASVYRMASASLALSDCIARRAGLERGTPGNMSEKGEVVLPGSKVMTSLKRAVSFSSEEFARILLEIGSRSDALQDLILQLGEARLDEYSLSNGILLQRPIVRTPGEFLVPNPENLLSAATHLILKSLATPDIRSVFVNLYPNVVLECAERALRYVRHLPIRFCPHELLSVEGIRERFYHFDTDKLLHLLLVCDTLENFDPKTIDAVWKTPGLEAAIANRIETVASELYASPLRPNSVMSLVILAGVNRAHQLVFRKRSATSLFLAMTAEDLEIICKLEAGNRLALWNFAAKSLEARRTMRIACFDLLDEYSMYKSCEYSYYVHDGPRPETLVIKPGGGTRLKIQISEEQDWHPVLYMDGSSVVMVNALYDTKGVPLYVPGSEGHLVYVENLPCPVWVHVDSEITSTNEHSVYSQFVAATAYWMWQLSPFIHQHLDSSMRALPGLYISISISEVILNSYLKHTPKHAPTENSPQEPAVSARVEHLGEIRLHFNNNFVKLLRLTDNVGERELIRVLLPALVQATGASGELSSAEIERLLEQHAPVGLKRMLLWFNAGYRPELDPRDLPSYRPVQPGAIQDVLDDVDAHLRSKGMQPGEIKQSASNEILKDVVGFCLSEISRTVATLKPEGLLEFLIVLHEALVHESSFNQLTLATRLQTFEHNPDMADRLAKESHEFAHSGIAARFIIEFVAAQPPCGYRKMSLEVYDRLQALANELISFGAVSDTLHFKLNEVKLWVEPSARLAVDNSRYLAAGIVQLGFMTLDRMAHAEDLFREYAPYPEDQPDQHPRASDEIEHATRAEFGFSISELSEFLLAAGELGAHLTPSTPSKLPLSQFISMLGSELGWEHLKIEKCLNLFSLRSRPNFLAPPAGSRIEDLYPWRFNRNLSYIRRPLAIRSTGSGPEIIWGHRQVELARFYLVRLCSSTRLKAKSPEMRSLLGVFRRKAGERFNTRVYNVLNAIGGLILKKRVAKIGGLRTGNLGDIDVLCADHNNSTLWVIECKSLALVRTAYETASELQALTVGTASTKSIIEKHGQRAEWVRKHRTDIFTWLGIKNSTGWKVKPVIVVDAIPLSPWLQKLSMAVVTLDSFRRQLERR